VRQVRYIFHVGIDAFYTFLADDGGRIASHIALSTLMALFPFLIVLTSLAGLLRVEGTCDQAAGLMLPDLAAAVADSLSGEIHDVLTTTRRRADHTPRARRIFRVECVASLRVAAQPRLCGDRTARRWYWLRLESMATR